MLPEEDGLTILNSIRQTPAYSEIPVIMVTAKTSEIDAVKGLDMGADDYITKPFTSNSEFFSAYISSSLIDASSSTI